MRLTTTIMVIFAICIMAGCGGGGGSTTTPAQSGFTVADTKGFHLASGKQVLATTADFVYQNQTIVFKKSSGKIVSAAYAGLAQATSEGYAITQLTPAAGNVLMVFEMATSKYYKFNIISVTSQKIVFDYAQITAPVANTLATSPDNNLFLTGSSSAIPAGTTVEIKSLAANSPELPTTLEGPAFVAAALSQPDGTVFTEPVSLVFKLAVAISPSTEVRLYEYVAALKQWVYTGATATISADGTTATVQISSLSKYYALFSGPN